MNRIPFSTFIQFYPRLTGRVLTEITNYIITGSKSIQEIEKGIEIKVKKERITVMPDDVMFEILSTILKFMR